MLFEEVTFDISDRSLQLANAARRTNRLSVVVAVLAFLAAAIGLLLSLGLIPKLS